MKLTLPWLREHLDTDASLSEIVDRLTMIGLEVENVEDKANLLKPFVIASVISAEKHPNADRLRVCMVDIGDGKPIQVFKCHFGDNQRFTMSADGHIREIKSQKCLEIAKAAQSAAVMIDDCDPAKKEQMFVLGQ